MEKKKEYCEKLINRFRELWPKQPFQENKVPAGYHGRNWLSKDITEFHNVIEEIKTHCLNGDCLSLEEKMNIQIYSEDTKK